jgi:hypothetical protein
VLFLVALRRGPFVGRTQAFASAVPVPKYNHNLLLFICFLFFKGVCCECRKHYKQEANVWNDAIGMPGAGRAETGARRRRCALGGLMADVGMELAVTL